MTEASMRFDASPLADENAAATAPVDAAARVSDHIADMCLANMPDLGDLPLPVEGFNLMPHRLERIQRGRRRARCGAMLAVCLGVVGAVALELLSARQDRIASERRVALAQRLADLQPALAERHRLEALVAADDARRERRMALEPRRVELVSLLNILTVVSREGLAIGNVSLASEEGERIVRIGGIADDADAVAAWIEALSSEEGIDDVELDELHRLGGASAKDGDTAADPIALISGPAAHEDAPSGLNAFRVSARLDGVAP